MFRDDLQRSRAVRALLATLFDEARLRELWAVDPEWGDALERPTQWMQELCYGGGPISSGELVLVRCAMDFWSGGEDGGARFGDVLYRLDGKLLAAVATLMLAYNSGAIDKWIADVECGHHVLIGAAPLNVARTIHGPREACWTCGACGFEKYPRIEERAVSCNQCEGSMHRRGAICPACGDVVGLDANGCPCGARWSSNVA